MQTTCGKYLKFYYGRNRFKEASREWPSGLMHSNQNQKVAGSSPLGAQPGLGTQPCYKAPSDLQVEYVEHK